jgi:outer membrane immunogenic protein
MGIVLGAHGTGVDIRGTSKKPDLEGEGFAGGIVAGYNFRSGHWVGGFEADLTSAGFNESKTVTGLGTVKASSDVTGSVRLRGGFAWDRVMLYTTAGIAFSDLEVQSSLGGKESGVRAGLALGLGAEVAMDNNWAARLEAIGYGFGIDEEKLGGAKHDVAFGRSQIRLGLSRRF